MFLLGGKKVKSKITAAAGVDFQNSCYGKPITIVYGTTRVAPNLLWTGDFKSHAQKQKRSSGKGGITGGGGKGGGTAGYTYTLSMIMALCEGPIEGFNRVYVNKDVVTLASLGFSTFNGTYPQAAWGFMTTNHPAEALGYNGIAYVAASNYKLGSSPQIPNHNFEVKGVYSASLVAIGKVDADPSLVVADFLANSHYGVGFPSSRVGSMTAFQAYCIANGLWISPSYQQQSSGASILDDIAKATNSEVVWSEGELSLIPYGDQTKTANGYTYTAPSAPLYDLTDNDFISATGEAPVKCVRKRPSDAYNSLKMEYLDRGKSYNPAIVEAKDQAMIDAFGLRQDSTRQYHMFCDTDAAKLSVQLMLSRQGVRNEYTFTVDMRYLLLDPMDIVTITDSGLGLSRQWVRIKSIDENDDMSLTITAEEYLQGTGSAALYGTQGNDGFNPSTDCHPGNTFAVITDVPLCLDQNAPSVWIAAGGNSSGQDAQKGSMTFWYQPIALNAGSAPAGISNSIDDIFSIQGESTLQMICARRQASSSPLGDRGKFSLSCGIEVNQNPDENGDFQNECFLFIPTVLMAASINPICVAVTWDGTGTTWVGKIFINGVDMTDYSAQAAQSFVFGPGGLIPGTDMGVPLDGSKIFQLTDPVEGQCYVMGYRIPGYFPPTAPVDFAPRRFQVAQFWILCGDALDFSDPTVWAKFFDVLTGAPADLGSDGTRPAGRRPLIYLPHDTSSLGVNEGILGDINEFTHGSIVDATGIPANGSYQAVGLDMPAGALLVAASPLEVVNPESAACDVWASAVVWISTDGGVSYNQVGTIDAPSPAGRLTAELPFHVDPDTTDTLSVDTSYTGQELPTFTQAEADAFLSLCVITDGLESEFLAYETATLTTNSRYDLTYLRRGLYNTDPGDWLPNSFNQFARLDAGVIKIPYSRDLIGKVMYVKIQPRNGFGGGEPDLSEISPIAYLLRGPAAGTLRAPLAMGASEDAGVVTLSWPPGRGCSLTGYDVGIYAAFDFAFNGNFGAITCWFDPKDTATVGVCRIWEEAATYFASPFVSGSFIDVYMNQTPLGVPDAGKFYVSHKIRSKQAGVAYILWTATTAFNIVDGPVAIGINYDGTTTTWSAKIFVNNADATDTVFQAANSSHGGTPGLVMGAVLDPTQVAGLPSTFGGNFTAWPTLTFDTLPYGVSQLWLGAAETIDLSVGANWDKFFDASNNPIPLGAQGELPTGHVPYGYFPTDPFMPGQGAGQLAGAGDGHGVIGVDDIASGTQPNILVNLNSAVAFSPDQNFGWLARNTPDLSLQVSGLAAGDYTFQVRSVDSLGFRSSTWTYVNFTVT